MTFQSPRDAPRPDGSPSRLPRRRWRSPQDATSLTPAWERRRRKTSPTPNLALRPWISWHRAPTPRRSARRSTEAPSPSRAPSSTISRSALSTVALLPIHAPQNGAVSGRHRRQGRKPAASADAADGKNETLADRAGRTGHRYRTARHKTGLAPGAPDRIPRSPATWTR